MSGFLDATQCNSMQPFTGLQNRAPIQELDTNERREMTYGEAGIVAAPSEIGVVARTKLRQFLDN
jgi:hypothetical protein